MITTASITDRLRSLIGPDTIIMAFASGQKGPRFVGWPSSTKGDLTPEQEDQINTGTANAGVLLVNGLAAIDLDTDQAEEDFLDANPALLGSFSVKGKKGRKILVRFSDGYPIGGQKIKDANGLEVAEILGEKKNATLAGLHPDGMAYEIVSDGPPVTLTFDEIVWPDYFDLGGILSAARGQLQEEVNRLKNKFGEPYRYAQKADEVFICGFNERFWGGLYATEREVVFLPELSSFFEYDPATGLFKAETAEAIRERLGSRLFLAADEENRPEIRPLCSVQRLDLIVKALQGIAEHRDFFQERPRAIHVANGMILESEDGLIFEDAFSPRYRSRNRSPFSFTESATCPRFLNELLNPMLPDPDDRLLLQKWAGIALFGVNLPQRILIFDGTPGRGKGVLLRVLRGIIGRANITELRTQHLGEKFELNRFIGKTLLAASDVPGDFLQMKWASMLKSLVGGDPLNPEAKGSNDLPSIDGIFSVLVVSNSRLRCRLDGDVNAWRRRLMILRTDAPPVKKRIAAFENILLRDEGDGILLWALKGFEMAMGDIAEDGDLHLTDGQWSRVDDLMSESNVLEIFVKTMIKRCRGSAITVDEIEKNCADFCADRGWQIPRISNLHRDLPDLMLKEHGAAKSHSVKTEDGTRKGFRGVAFKEVSE